MSGTLRIGVDGCPGGWLAVAIDPGGRWHGGVYPSLAALAEQVGGWELMLIDMPIGLPDRNPRACDREARRLLGGRRGSSVFPVPCRAVLEAADYLDACAINRAHLGVALSKQSWNLLPKIRELDRWLRGGAPGHCREAHPELVFQALNGAPLAAGKRSAAGLECRRTLLSDRFPATGEVLEDLRRRHSPSRFAIHDALDALALAIAARLGEDALARLPAEVQTDGMGLPMEIVFPGGDHGGG